MPISNHSGKKVDALYQYNKVEVPMFDINWIKYHVSFWQGNRANNSLFKLVTLKKTIYYKTNKGVTDKRLFVFSKITLNVENFIKN